ncbi:MAG: YMGG-like glycine zipper-containing protein [Pyrinomonadaceae bacterium]
MKKLIATITLMAMMFVMLPFAANAQVRRSNRYASSTYKSRTYSRPSFYSRHRNVINVGVGTGAGALLGAIIGGKKGAAIGALAGAGGSALYTYKIKPKSRRY